MAGLARPNHLKDANEGQISLISSRIRVLEGQLNIDNSINPLFNGVTTSPYTYGTALFSKVQGSYIEFTVNNTSKIWAICDKPYGDSGGISPKDILVEIYVNGKWETIRQNITYSNNNWYDLTGELKKGRYRISPVADYVNINELFVEDFLITRSFVYHENEYKYYDQSKNMWISMGSTEPTYQQYMDFGMTNLSPKLDRVSGVSPLDVLSGSKTFKIYINEKDNYNLSVEGKIKSQLVYPNSDISLLGVDTIDSISLTYKGDSRIAISFDSGNTWLAYKNGVWKTIENAHSGMTTTELNALTRDRIEQVRNKSDYIRFSYSLTDIAEVDSIKMTVSLLGHEELAKVSDFEISHDAVNNKIIYKIKKTGTYSINYVDA